MLPRLCSSSKIGCFGQELGVDFRRKAFGRIRGRLSVNPPPVMWAAPFRSLL